MAKMGRPKKAVIKDKSVTVRLSPETYQKLMSYISATGQTITEVVLSMGLGFPRPITTYASVHLPSGTGSPSHLS